MTTHIPLGLIRRETMRTWLTPVIALFISVSAPAFASELTELAERTKSAVVLLTIEDSGGRKIGAGTGFFVSSDGRIITNHHVVDGAAKVIATLSDGSRRAVLGVLASDKDRDIAILKAEGEALPALQLGDSSGVKPGDEVVVIGSPMGLAGTLTVGIVSAIRAHGAGEETEWAPDPEKVRSWGIQITAAISPGSSGSPIMTRSGEVIAVAVGNLSGAQGRAQGLNFGVPIEVAKSMLSGLGPQAKVTPLSGAEEQDVLRNLLISAAVLVAVAFVYFLWDRFATRRAEARSARPRRPIR